MTFMYVKVNYIVQLQRDESVRLAWFVSGWQVALLSETQIHTNNYLT